MIFPAPSFPRLPDWLTPTWVPLHSIITRSSQCKFNSIQQSFPDYHILDSHSCDCPPPQAIKQGLQKHSPTLPKSEATSFQHEIVYAREEGKAKIFKKKPASIECLLNTWHILKTLYLILLTPWVYSIVVIHVFRRNLRLKATLSPVQYNARRTKAWPG